MEMEMEKKRGRRFIMDDDELSIETKTKTKRGRLFIMGGGAEDLKVLLPPEIITHEIISRLPADSVMGCRGISKQWRSLIDHRSFWVTHTRQVISSSTSNPKKFGNYLIPNSSTSSSGLLLFAQQQTSSFQLQFVEYNDDYYYVEKKSVLEFKPCKPITDHPFPFYCDYWGNKWGPLLISSCNGLVFMGSTKPNYINDMFVCNPFTREYLNLRSSSSSSATTKDDDDDAREERRRRRSQETKGCRMAYGFGYLPSTDEYKIVSVYYPESKGVVNGKFSVYTLGSGRWRNKGEIPYWLYSQLHPGFFANGAIHWFTNTEKRKIVSFDLADEKFRVIVPMPPPPPSAYYYDKLGVLGGCLCVTRSDTTKCESPKDIWVLNDNFKEKKFLWKKRFSIPWKGTTSGSNPLIVLKSGKILLHGDFGLISYDSETEAFNEDCLDSKTEALSEDEEDIFHDPSGLKVIPYAKSLVCLKALGEKDAKFFRAGVSRSLAQQPQQHG